MRFSINSGQTRVLAEFCKDLAKGIALGAILGQGVGVSQSNLILTMAWVSLAMAFLLFAMKFSSYDRN